jgi:hypothetical protein
MAVIIPEKAIIDPQERSIPPPMITIDWPKALMAIHEKALNMLKILVGVKKVLV